MDLAFSDEARIALQMRLLGAARWRMCRAEYEAAVCTAPQRQEGFVRQPERYRLGLMQCRSLCSGFDAGACPRRRRPFGTERYCVRRRAEILLPISMKTFS